MNSITRKIITRSHFGQWSIRRAMLWHLLLIGALALAACQPVMDTRTGEPTGERMVSPASTVDAGTTEADTDDIADDAAEDAAEDTGESADTEAGTTTTGPAIAAEILVNPASATITARSLRVREAPDPDAEVVAGAREGEAYPVIAISADGAWVQIEIARSETGEGWVSSNFITLEGDITETASVPVAQPSAAPSPVVPFGEVAPPTATVDTRSLIVRAEPEEDSLVIAGLNLGDSFNVLGLSPDGVWIQLELPEIEEGAGWIQSNFVRLAGDLTAIPTIGEEEVDATDLPVTDADATDEEVTDADDTLAEATDEAAADEDATDETDVAGNDIEVLPTTATTATVNTRSLFVRETPNTGADPVAGARQGESYPVIGESADGLWLLIQTPRSETGQGWVFAEFVDVE